MRSDIVPGAIFPDYELSDQKRRKLSELQGQDPMVLILSRGGYCPKDRRQHEGLVQLHREIEVGYCRMVTISTDDITEANEYRSGVGAHWPFLSDAGRIVQKDLNIAEYTDSLHNPMIPHTIVLEPGLVIYKIYMGYWFFGRPTMEELRQDLRAVTKKCRPDWEITAPELKAAWEQRRKELFYPYGKKYVQTLGEQDWERSYHTQGGAVMNLKLEAIITPSRKWIARRNSTRRLLGFRVDVDHHAAVYEEALGFRHRGEENYRIVQLTPPGSECSIQIGTGITRATPGSFQGMYLISSDIEATRAELVERGVGVSEPFYFGPKGPSPPLLEFGR
jgi:peroxiredoxin